MNKFFTSDTHFGHNNILKYCGRPFSSIEEHDEELIRRWNSVVGKADLVYHGGDFAFVRKEEAYKVSEIVDRLNGNIIIVPGNHDYSYVLRELAKSSRVTIEDKILDLTIMDEEMEDGKQRITLCHYPMISWNCSHRGAWQLFGHHHGSTSAKGMNVYEKITTNQLEIGVDVHDLTPVSYDEVKVLITKKNLRA